MLRILAVVTGFFALSACATEESFLDAPTDELTSEIGRCPEPVFPGEQFCQDGTIVLVKGADGCKHWECERAELPEPPAPVAGPPTCPSPVYPGEGFCQDGTIVLVKGDDGCSFYDCQR